MSERIETLSRSARTEAVSDGAEKTVNPQPTRLKKTHKVDHRPPFDCIALLLQGGGALGSYQAGVYEALAEAGIPPDWVAGISIGSINAAIIVGNPPKTRVDKLKEFWQTITGSVFGPFAEIGALFARGDSARGLFNQVSAGIALTSGAPGFFQPRTPGPSLNPPGTLEATSYYDTGPLKATLERLIDFDRINADNIRLSLGAVNVRNGNLIYFDTTTHVIRPEHVMASGSLPPGFPAIEIEGEFYRDGGLVSNTPLQWLAMNRQPDTLAFQVDVWSARGEFPRNLAEVATRQKEIQFSSRTRAFTDVIKYLNTMHYSIAGLLEQLPDEFKKSDEAKFLISIARRRVHNIVHLIYRPRGYESQSKDYEFSRQSMVERWRAGYDDTVHTLRHPEVLERPTGVQGGVFTFDLARDY